jgi:hypothetical protein
MWIVSFKVGFGFEFLTEVAMVFWLHRSLIRDSSDLHGGTNRVTVLFIIKHL